MDPDLHFFFLFFFPPSSLMVAITAVMMVKKKMERLSSPRGAGMAETVSPFSLFPHSLYSIISLLGILSCFRLRQRFVAGLSFVGTFFFNFFNLWMYPL